MMWGGAARHGVVGEVGGAFGRTQAEADVIGIFHGGAEKLAAVQKAHIAHQGGKGFARPRHVNRATGHQPVEGKLGFVGKFLQFGDLRGRNRPRAFVVGQFGNLFVRHGKLFFAFAR